jgi:vacuolar iron transporter family protein
MAETENSHDKMSNSRLNWLRASVLGANDGIVSVSSIVLGVAGATNSRGAIFTAGLAGLVAGALSMAAGEYVSVSSQRDTERAYIAKEKRRLKNNPDHEIGDLAKTFEEKGLSSKTARQVAKELTERDALKAHLDVELNLDEEDLNNPTEAAVASLLSFTVGGVIPMIAVLTVAENLRLPVTFVAVLVALTITGYVSATVGNAPRRRAVIRVVVGGAVAMLATYGIGHLFGTAIG